MITEIKDTNNLTVIPMFTKVTKVTETTDIDTVNRLIKENWILLHIAPSNDGSVFSLGQLIILEDER